MIYLKDKHNNTVMLPILFDEMYENLEERLIKRGYEAYSVRKLRKEKNLKLQYDYSIIKYVEQNKMILITEEIDNKNGCDENNIPCIRLGQNPSADEMIQQLEKYKDLTSQTKILKNFFDLFRGK